MGSEKVRDMTKLGRAVFLSVAALSSIPAAQAQPRRGLAQHGRAPFHTDHWLYDDRFHHNHYYPAIGYHLGALPPGNIAVAFRGGHFWFHSGVWYQRMGPSFVVVRPPFGIIVPVLPPAYSVVYYSGLPYYYADETYYVQQPTGYEVVAPPEAPTPPPAPAAAAAQPTQAAGTWYYCESSKTYYPYVQQCPEGWKSVPASPPPAPR
ncbi:MAG TPA: DUF6515 family protein [Burkholderiales bacterium]|nr:DUF6515 family protein [Burkholderiales bacterium]